MPVQPILQYEFFLTEKGASLEEILEQSAQRLSENLEMIFAGQKPGHGIKCNIRIFDIDLYITEQAMRQKMIDEELRDSWMKMIELDLLRRFLYRIELWFLRRERAILQESIHQYAITYLEKAFGGLLNVVLENSDHSFEAVERDDLHELKEVISKSDHYWLFVFEPNELLADKNNIIVSLV